MGSSAANPRRIQGKQPMIMGVTGEYTKEVDKFLSESLGFDYYLVKPADPIAAYEAV